MSAQLKKLEKLGRKILFRITAPEVSSENVPESLPAEERLNSLLIMRQDRIGDMIMTLPLIRRVRDVWPGIRIGIVASELNRIILRHETHLDVITCRKKPGGFVSSLVEARNFNPDAAVDMHMHDSTTSFIYALCSGAKWSLHVDRDNRLPFNVRVRAPQDGHIMDAFAGLLSGLGKMITTASMQREVSLSREETDFAKEFWNTQRIPPSDCVAVNVSAGSENRHWGMDRYSRVCGSIIEMGLKPLILYSPDDADSADALRRYEPDVVLSPVTPTILHVAALIKGAALLVSPDTSVVHLAASYGIPVTGLYLPFDPSLPKWFPWDVRSRILMTHDNQSLDSIQPDTVADAVKELLY